MNVLHKQIHSWNWNDMFCLSKALNKFSLSRRDRYICSKIRSNTIILFSLSRQLSVRNTINGDLYTCVFFFWILGKELGNRKFGRYMTDIWQAKKKNRGKPVSVSTLSCILFVIVASLSFICLKLFCIEDLDLNVAMEKKM